MSWARIFIYLPYAFFVLTMAVFVLPLKLKVRAQTIWALALLVCFSKFRFFKALGGHAFVPNLPAAVIWTWDWLYSGAMILSVLGLLLVFFRFRAKVWLLPAIAWGLAAWGLYNGVRAPDVREVELKFADLPPSLDGYRIVQISDLHCSKAARRWRTQTVVDMANGLKPDLICLTGDLSDGKVGRVGCHLEPLKELRARDGVFACTGNHEYYSGYRDWLTQFYAKAENIRFLTNECALPHPGLALAGVPDPAGFKRKFDAAPDVRRAFAAATNGEFRVLLQHQPKWAETNVREAGVDLQLSGHIHGGIAPGFRSIIERFNGGFSRGAYRFGKSVLYVSPGCGQWAGFPMRFFNPSEIVLITLRQGK